MNFFKKLIFGGLLITLPASAETTKPNIIFIKPTSQIVK